jgi:hypothetical protein
MREDEIDNETPVTYQEVWAWDFRVGLIGFTKTGIGRKIVHRQCP